MHQILLKQFLDTCIRILDLHLYEMKKRNDVRRRKYLVIYCQRNIEFYPFIQRTFEYVRMNMGKIFYEKNRMKSHFGLVLFLKKIRWDLSLTLILTFLDYIRVRIQNKWTKEMSIMMPLNGNEWTYLLRLKIEFENIGKKLSFNFKIYTI